MTEGLAFPDIGNYYGALAPFCKHSDPAPQRDRKSIRSWPVPGEPDHARLLSPEEIAKYKAGIRPEPTFALRQMKRTLKRWMSRATKSPAA
jgi:hypothetical protein